MDLSRPSAELQDPSRNPQCPPTMASRDKQGKMGQSTINSKTIIIFLIDIYAIKCSAMIILLGRGSSNARASSYIFNPNSAIKCLGEIL